MRAVALPLAAFGLLAGCSVNIENHGPSRHTTKSVELDRSEIVRASLKMGAGELSVSGGSSNLMDGDFEYQTAEPAVSYHSSGVRGDLTVEEPTGGKLNSGDYKWNLRLNDKVPMDFVAHLGAGEAHLKIGGLVLRSVEVHMGVGQLDLDLRGYPTRDYDVQIHGGVGEANVYLPANAAISANAKGGIGEITTGGLEKRGGRWVNPKHEHAPATIRMEIAGGVGSIHLITE